MTLVGMAGEQQQDISGKIKRFERASMKLENRGPEGKAKVKDANDNYTTELETKQDGIGKKIQLMEARLGSIDEENSRQDDEKPRSPSDVLLKRSPRSASNENLLAVGSPELRRKMSSHFLRKSSAPSLLATVPDESRFSKADDQTKEKEQFVREDVPHVFVFPSADSDKIKETEEGQHGEREGEHLGGGQSGGKDGGKGMTKRISRVRKSMSMRFSRREKKSHDTDHASKGKNEATENEDCKQVEEKDKCQVSIIVSKSPSDIPPNKEIVRELSSFKFKGPRPVDERGVTKSTSDKATPETSLMDVNPKQGDSGDGKKGLVAVKPNRRRNRQIQLPVPPSKPPSQRQTNSIHEYDLISFGDDGAQGVQGVPSMMSSDKEQEEKPLNPVYATLCPSDEEEEGSSDADPAIREDIKFIDTRFIASRTIDRKFAEHVYEDIDKVMAKVKKLPVPDIGAYQVSNLTHTDIEPVKPVVYDEPQAHIESSPHHSPKPVSYDQPASYTPTPSREIPQNSGGDGVVKNPGARNWAHRLPSDTSSGSPQSYDVPQTGPKGSQKPHLGSGRGGGSTPHSPTTVVPPQDDLSVPRGWRVEQTVTRDPVFINEITSEKWYKATPTQGEPYYYSEDRSQTRWDLPSVPSSPRHRMVSEGGGQADEPKLPSQKLRQGKASSVRPHSFHPHLRSSSPSIPYDGRFVDKDEIKRRFNNRISLYAPTEMEVREKEGMLSMVLMKDRVPKKKSRPGYAVLAGSQLKYYKDHKHYERDASNPEVSLTLFRNEVCWCRSRTPGKRLIFELSTTDQGIFLVQGEDEMTSQAWFEAIRGAVGGRTGSSSDIPEELYNSSPLTPTGLSPPVPDAPPMKKSNSRIREKLKNFIFTRPDKEDLRRKGILQEENVFGKDIGKLCEKERTTVPGFVNQCIRCIDKRGLECDGIYRVSGNLSLIQKLRFLVDQEKPIDLESSPWKEDIHVIAGALKLYFRELPEPLFTFNTFDKFIASINQIPGTDQKILAFRELFGEMPRVNQDTIFALFSHLKRVMDNVHHNRMPAKNVATVFGPTLMWPERENINMAMATVYQNQVMEFVLLEFDNIFR
ncbi:rho GTPase-activating protein 27 isoform X4 [Strongylocentrotus purpuratus]|uniref:Uncharacterized protein n=1 Tax=Strongylocentrotus purpuratus TaxID=7668 RepID=A0A7M7P6M3_STRPU|nr:rho GTPase-activating protein 27 isoform X4 [Strongylocentrotus purpuratus]